jgi:hypothetical protein
MNDFLDFAQRLLDIVRTAWIENCEREGGIAGTDESDRQFLLGYVHAFRRFRAIKRLAEDEQPSPEAVMVLIRSLVSVTHRALYLVSSADPDVREERRKRFFLLGVREELTYLEGIADEVPAVRPTLELARESVRLREEVFKKAGWSLARPIFPTDEQIAKELGLPAHYAEVYRPGSSDTHYSVFSAAGGFADLEGETPTIALLGDDVNELMQPMLRAIVVYAEFLIAAEKVVELGVGPQVEELRPTFARVVERAKAELEAADAATTAEEQFQPPFRRARLAPRAGLQPQNRRPRALGAAVGSNQAEMTGEGRLAQACRREGDH